MHLPKLPVMKENLPAPQIHGHTCLTIAFLLDADSTFWSMLLRAPHCEAELAGPGEIVEHDGRKTLAWHRMTHNKQQHA